MARDCCDCDTANGPDLAEVADLLRDRVNTIEELADAAVYFYRQLDPAPELVAQHVADDNLAALRDFADKLQTCEWNRTAIHDLIKSSATAHGLKMPKIAMPLRVLVTGEAQTPSVDAVLMLIGREEVLRRLNLRLAQIGAGA
jgi:glutamyl-tRNA synthetase